MRAINSAIRETKHDPEDDSYPVFDTQERILQFTIQYSPYRWNSVPTLNVITEKTNIWKTTQFFDANNV